MRTIGIITEDYWRGGLARFSVNLVNNWPDKNARFIVFTNKENTVIKENINNPNVEYVYFDFKTVSSDMGAKKGILKKIFRRTFFKYGFFIVRYFTLKRLVNKYNIDGWIISNGGYPGSDLCRLALLVLKKEKGIFVFHGAVQKPWPLFLLFEMLLDRIIFCGNKFKFITVSYANAKTLSKRPWIANIHVNVIHNGIARTGSILQKTRSSDKHIVAMLSGLRLYKGQAVVIQAASYLKSTGFDLKVRFYGVDFERFLTNIKEMIKTSGYPEIFSMPGFCSVEKIMEEADLVVVPSLTHESFGYVAAEAMCYGVPVIVSDVGGLPEVVGDSGVICRAGDVNVWTQAIKEVLIDDELRGKNIKRGIKRASENFSIEDMVRKYGKLLMQDGEYDIPS